MKKQIKQFLILSLLFTSLNALVLSARTNTETKHVNVIKLVER